MKVYEQHSDPLHAHFEKANVLFSHPVQLTVFSPCVQVTSDIAFFYIVEHSFTDLL